MLLKLANRNILGNGWRSLINMLILSIVLIGIIWMGSMYYSWINLAKQQMKDWEHGVGMLWQKDLDLYDAFSWDKSFAPLTDAQMQAIKASEAVPILISPAVAYPQGRMVSAIIKGIPADQTVLKLPTQYLSSSDSTLVPAIIGSSLARNTRLKEGDTLTLRIKDRHGVFDALDIRIAHIMKSPVPTVDAQAFWIDLCVLQHYKDLDNHASQIVLADLKHQAAIDQNWRYVPLSELLADLNAILKTEMGQQMMMFGLLLFLAMLAIFDTQILALFKRRKEIGTLNALGMTQSKIIALFTLEGILYMLYSIVLSTILGLPLFLWFGIKGWTLPDSYSDFGMVGFTEPIHFKYPPSLIVAALILMLICTAIASWLPTLRIAKMKPTDALRGKLK